MQYLDAGASHVVVTSYVFRDGQVDLPRLSALRDLVGKERLVLDLSCRKKPVNANTPTPDTNPYYVVTNKWTQYTDYTVDRESLTTLAQYCAEFLIHGVDVEGKKCGIEEELVVLLGQHSPIPVISTLYSNTLNNSSAIPQFRSFISLTFHTYTHTAG